MHYPVTLKGYEGRLVLVRDGWFATPQLLLDGIPVQSGGPRGPFALPGDDGNPKVGVFRYRFLDPIPQIQVGKETVSVVPPLTWSEWIFICLPLLTVLVDPLAGALIGAVAATFNAQIFRSQLSRPVMFVASVLVTLSGLGLYAVIIEIVKQFGNSR